MSKIKVFLGGYINYTNAQNLNCRAVAEHLNRAEFDVFTLTYHFGEQETFRVNTFNCFKPFSFSKHLGFLWGILSCDVAYLPKHVDTPLWVLKFARILNKPLFTTIEGNVSDLSKPNLIDLFGSNKKIKSHFGYFNQVFGITSFLIKESQDFLSMENTPLSLGVNLRRFNSNIKKELKSIVFVGGLIKRKRLDEFLELASFYPQIIFHIIGDGPEKDNLLSNASTNVVFHSLLSHSEINHIFQKSDLMFLPAKSEGFPKVILESASAGVPSIVYDDYGASDWMTHRKDGFIVSDFSEVKEVVDELLMKPKLLQLVSENTLTLAKKFDWKKVIVNWEQVILRLYNGK